MDATSVQDPAIEGLSAVSAVILRDGWDGSLSVFVSRVPDVAVRIAAFERLANAIKLHSGSRDHIRYPALYVSRWLADPDRTRAEIAAVMRSALHA